MRFCPWTVHVVEKVSFRNRRFPFSAAISQDQRHRPIRPYDVQNPKAFDAILPAVETVGPFLLGRDKLNRNLLDLIDQRFHTSQFWRASPLAFTKSSASLNAASDSMSHMAEYGREKAATSRFVNNLSPGRPIVVLMPSGYFMT
jgi:hypothetical protein